VALDQTEMLYAVVKGGYTFTSAEKWQFGLHFLPFFGLTNPDDEGTPTGRDTDVASVSRTETDWTISSEWLLTESSITFSPDDFLNDSLAPSVQNNFGDGVNTKCHVESITLYPLLHNGKVNDGRKTVLEFTGGIPGGNMSGNMVAMEDAIAVSFGSTRPGRKGRGRAYLPPAGNTVFDTNGFVSSSIQDDVRDGWQNLLQDGAQSGTLGTLHWTIWPVIANRPATRYTVIGDVRVGNVMDRQVRRRKGIPETYNTPAAVVH